MVDIPSKWSEAKDVPLACNNWNTLIQSNLITPDSLRKWCEDVQDIGNNHDSIFNTRVWDILQKPITADDVMRHYGNLRFLSQSCFEKGIDLFAEDIHKTYDPKDTLMLVEGNSSRMVYGKMSDRVGEFGLLTSTDPYKRPSLKHLGRYDKADRYGEKAEKVVFVDDWILSGEQLINRVYPLISSLQQLVVYAIVVSMAGNYVMKMHGLNGKTPFKIEHVDDESRPTMGRYALFGFHKVPDRIHPIFVDSNLYTIFADRTVAPGERLVDYGITEHVDFSF